MGEVVRNYFSLFSMIDCMVSNCCIFVFVSFWVDMGSRVLGWIVGGLFFCRCIWYVNFVGFVNRCGVISVFLFLIGSFSCKVSCDMKLVCVWVREFGRVLVIDGWYVCGVVDREVDIIMLVWDGFVWCMVLLGMLSFWCGGKV